MNRARKGSFNLVRTILIATILGGLAATHANGQPRHTAPTHELGGTHYADPSLHSWVPWQSSPNSPFYAADRFQGGFALDGVLGDRVKVVTAANLPPDVATFTQSAFRFNSANEFNQGHDGIVIPVQRPADVDATTAVTIEACLCLFALPSTNQNNPHGGNFCVVTKGIAVDGNSQFDSENYGLYVGRLPGSDTCCFEFEAKGDSVDDSHGFKFRAICPDLVVSSTTSQNPSWLIVRVVVQPGDSGILTATFYSSKTGPNALQPLKPLSVEPPCKSKYLVRAPNRSLYIGSTEGAYGNRFQGYIAYVWVTPSAFETGQRAAARTSTITAADIVGPSARMIDDIYKSEVIDYVDAKTKVGILAPQTSKIGALAAKSASPSAKSATDSISARFRPNRAKTPGAIWPGVTVDMLRESGYTARCAM